MRITSFYLGRRLAPLIAAIGLVGCTSSVERESDVGASPNTTSAGQKMDAPSLATVERAWSLIALDGTPVTVPTERSRPSLIFDAKTNRVSGLAAVNRFSGSYALGAGTLKLGPLMATKMAGAPELNELETRFLRALERVTAWRIVGNELELLDGENVLARFAPKS